MKIYSGVLYSIEKEEKPSAARRLTDSSFVYLQQGSGLYPAFDIATKLIADVLYARWDDCEFIYNGGKPDITTKKLTNFIKRMGVPDTKDQDLIDTKKVCFKDREISIPVRKITELQKQLNGEPLAEEQYHDVTILHICKRTDTDKEKIATLDSIRASCDCKRYRNQEMCRAPADQRRLFGDYRDRLSIPCPYVIPFDLHICFAMNYASLYLDAYNMGIFGYPNFVVQTEKELIVKMRDLHINRQWPLYRINWAFQDFGHNIFDPLIRIAKAMTLEEQIKILNSMV